MAQQQHIPSSSHSGGGGASSDTDRSRNVKQKKVPQRGLGVAQLEKIRLEEQIKREREAATLQCPSLSLSPPNFHFRSPPSVPIRIYGGVEDQSISSSGNGGWCRNLQLESNAAAVPLPRRFFHFQHPASSPLVSSLA